jgi:hypothetical protein
MDFSNNKKSYSLIALKFGAINSIISFIFTVITKYSGLIDDFEETVGWISIIFGLLLTVSILVFGIREFREHNNNVLNYSTGLGLSSLIGAISGIISGAFNYIYLAFIDNSSTLKQLEKIREKWEEQGMTQSQIDQAEKMTTMFMGPGAQFVLLVFSSLLFFFLFGLIVSGIMKREKSIFE